MTKDPMQCRHLFAFEPVAGLNGYFVCGRCQIGLALTALEDVLAEAGFERRPADPQEHAALVGDLDLGPAIRAESVEPF